MSISVINIPGGKSRAVHILEKFVPEDTTMLYSPFFGSGAFEIYCANTKNIKVIGADKFEPLVNFWQCFLKSKTRVIDGIKRMLPMSKKEFLENKTVYQMLKSKYKQASLYFAMNRVAFNGMMQKYSHLRATRSVDNVLKCLNKFNVSNLTVYHQDYIEFLTKLPDSKKGLILFVDPPYKTKEYYYGWRGEMHKGFDHKELAKRLLSLTKTTSWMLCYNDCDEIRALYLNCSIFNVSWFHSMNFSNNKQQNPPKMNSEIVIISHKLNAALKL
jgi:DNA adenine methylase